MIPSATMFGFFKKPPRQLPANPGFTTGGKTAFANAARQWTEEFDVLALTASVLEERGDSIQKEKTWLVHPASGFILLPRLADLQPLDSGGVRTTTTIQVNHPVLAPGGLFEYQHSTGDNIADSIRKGIAQWAELDFVTLLEALQANPKSCTTLRMTFPSTEGKPARLRRAVLGPVAHFMERPPIEVARSATGGNQPEQHPECDEHPFCSCCLVTNSFEAFKELMEGSAFLGLRLFAARGEGGTPEADCRVNGEDWKKGADALREYVKTWPGTGYEFRKQYVVLQSIEEDLIDRK